MSNAILPVMPGLTWDYTRVPEWSTTTKSSVSQRSFRTANASFPKYRVKMSYEFLRQYTGFAEMATLVGFFNARNGGFDSFLWTDPDDNTVTAQALGTGDGSNKLFQLVRTFGGYVEPVFDANSAPLIYVNGALKTLTTDYTISTAGLVSFVTAPASTLPVTWTGTYYRRMVFVQDSAEFVKMANGLWGLKSLEMETDKP